MWFCARCSQMLTEICGRAGDKFVPWMTQQENVSKVSTCWQKKMAFPQQDSSQTAHQSMSWPEIHDIFCADHAMLKKALPVTVMPW